MMPATRAICRTCRRSYELSGSHPDSSAPCPYCGGSGAGSTSDAETFVKPAPHPGQNPTTPPAPSPYSPADPSPWDKVWGEGSLGTFGRFQLRELLGEGGFGAVYQAYDPRLDRDVALKVLRQADPGERVKQRFFREARAAARLRHPNIVAVHDAGCDDGRCWIAYQLISGRPLTRARDRRELDAVAAVRIIRALAEAVDHAHRQGVFHRDLKPANVIVDEQGRPHLTDFGLALRADLDSDLTRDGAVIGTPAYMSPEQAVGRAHQADERSDIYSLGVMLFELLCGRRPFDLAGEAAGGRPPSPRSIDPRVPAALGRICLKALALDPAERYGDAAALGRDLDHWLARPRRAAQGPRRVPASWLGVAAAVLILMAGFGTWSVWTSRPGGGPRPSATPLPHPAAGPPVSPLSIAAPAPQAHLVGNTRSMVYHRASCRALEDVARADRLSLADPGQAARCGFIPCAKCDPLGLGGRGTNPTGGPAGD